MIFFHDVLLQMSSRFLIFGFEKGRSSYLKIGGGEEMNKDKKFQSREN